MEGVRRSLSLSPTQQHDTSTIRRVSASLSQTAGPTTVERKCPTCRARNGGSEFAASKPRAESLDDETLAEHWRGFRSDKIFFTYLRCATCEQVYSPTYFSDEAVDELYHSMGDNTAGEDPATLTKTQGGYVDILALYSIRIG